MKKIVVTLLVIAGLVSSCGKKTEEAKTVDLAALKGSTLNILAWEGYADASFTKAFEEKYGVTVRGTYFGSSDELVSKLQSGGGKSRTSHRNNRTVNANLLRQYIFEI